MSQAFDVARAHDAMASEYDAIEDLWYTHLFNEIHRFVLDTIPVTAGTRALDVGCGTGFQTFLLARAGARVRGFDISRALVQCAIDKRQLFSEAPLEAWPFYRTSLGSCAAAQRAIIARADAKRGPHPVVPPVFELGDATDAAAYGGGEYDIMTCCGSVLSLINDHEAALDKMAAALAPGGILILEVEQRFNLDLLWPVVDRLLGGRLGYEQSWRQIAHNLLAPPSVNVRVDYPFELASGEGVILPIWLYSPQWLAQALRRRGLSLLARRGGHVCTNLIPSTVLHQQYPGGGQRWIFERLGALDRLLAGLWPFRGLGCSILYAVRRNPRS